MSNIAYKIYSLLNYYYIMKSLYESILGSSNAGANAIIGDILKKYPKAKLKDNVLDLSKLYYMHISNAIYDDKYNLVLTYSDFKDLERQGIKFKFKTVECYTDFKGVSGTEINLDQIICDTISLVCTDIFYTDFTKKILNSVQFNTLSIDSYNNFNYEDKLGNDISDLLQDKNLINKTVVINNLFCSYDKLLSSEKTYGSYVYDKKVMNFSWLKYIKNAKCKELKFKSEKDFSKLFSGYYEKRDIIDIIKWSDPDAFGNTDPYKTGEYLKIFAKNNPNIKRFIVGKKDITNYLK
jgi:hypothetical protein